MTDEKLDRLRSEIDEIDVRILDLLNTRMNVSLEIGRQKTAHNQNVVDRSREERILCRLAALNTGPMLHQTLDAVYREIFSGSRQLQEPVTIAYLGPRGTYSHDAAIERFGNSASFLACSGVRDVFEEVTRGQARFGVVPIENSIEGSVRETLDLLMSSQVKVCGEISLRIRHALMNSSGRMEDVRRVISHPQALAQCRQWLNRHLPGVPVEESSSTAKAAEIALDDAGAAAVANERAATRLGLQILHRSIQDLQENLTRFIVLGDVEPSATGRDRTSIVFWTEDRPGALFRILEAFAGHDINLSRIESRPDRGAGPWKYAFFVDLEAHRDEPRVATCLKEIGARHTMVKILGSFPIHPGSEVPASADNHDG